MRRSFVGFSIAFSLILAGCSSAPAPEAEKAAKAEQTPAPTTPPAPEPTKEAPPAPVETAKNIPPAAPAPKPPAPAKPKAKEMERTASGLGYQELTAGTGPIPKPTDTVRVHYRGTLTNGKQFDASYGGPPATFGVTQVIPCWTEALQKMKVGGKARLECPAKIAYGDRGVPQAGIGPGATLMFDVELLGIQ